jgi:hypothetical protein
MVSAGPSTPPGKLHVYSGKRVSVFVSYQSPLRGQASYEFDPVLGNVLKVLIEEGGGSPTELLLQESEWTGLVVAATGP